MKKIVLAFAALAAVMTASAQITDRVAKMSEVLNLRPCEPMNMKAPAKADNYTQKFASFFTDDRAEKCGVVFNAQNKVDHIVNYVGVGGYDAYRVVDSMVYDSLNQLVSLHGYQYMFATGLQRYVYRVDYTYDANGNVTSRKNYNSVADWEIGGTYTYTYNENNQLIRTGLVMGNDDDEFQYIEYTYRDGKLYQEKWYGYNFYSQTLGLEEIYTCSYNNNGQLILKTDTLVEDGIRRYSGKCTYTYDANGNMTIYNKYRENGQEVERRAYIFTDDLLETTLMPWTPEGDERPWNWLFENKNVYTFEEYWALDDDMVLQHICDYNYNYIPMDAVGIEDVAPVSVTIYPNPTSHYITISGIDAPAMMTLIDVTGRTVMSRMVNVNEKVDLSNLEKGIYVMKLADNRTAKVVVE